MDKRENVNVGGQQQSNPAAMPRLDARLQAVADQIHGGIHADIGSDHGHLLQMLLMSGQIDFGIAIENKPHPLENSRSALAGLNAEVRLADGFAGLETGQADSVSLCGMGGELMARLLADHPQHVPPTVIAQPNRRPEAVRRWGLASGYHLTDEQVTTGRIHYFVMRFEHNNTIIDPAYSGCDRESAELFGPLLLKRREPKYRSILAAECQYLQQLQGRTAYSQNRLVRLKQVLNAWKRPPQPAPATHR